MVASGRPWPEGRCGRQRSVRPEESPGAGGRPADLILKALGVVRSVLGWGGRCSGVTVGFADGSRTKDLEAGLLGGEPASDLAVSVGVAGFEPTTSSSRTKRAAKLRYTPVVAARESYVLPAPRPL